MLLLLLSLRRSDGHHAWDRESLRRSPQDNRQHDQRRTPHTKLHGEECGISVWWCVPCSVMCRMLPNAAGSRTSEVFCIRTDGIHREGASSLFFFLLAIQRARARTHRPPPTHQPDVLAIIGQTKTHATLLPHGTTNHVPNELLPSKDLAS